MSPVGFDSRGTYRSDGGELGMVAATAGKRTGERERSRGQVGEGEAGIVGGVSSLSSRGHGKGGAACRGQGGGHGGMAQQCRPLSPTVTKDFCKNPPGTVSSFLFYF